MQINCFYYSKEFFKRTQFKIMYVTCGKVNIIQLILIFDINNNKKVFNIIK